MLNVFYMDLKYFYRSTSWVLDFNLYLEYLVDVVEVRDLVEWFIDIYKLFICWFLGYYPCFEGHMGKIAIHFGRKNVF